jgi:hypothetical protein
MASEDRAERWKILSQGPEEGEPAVSPAEANEALLVLALMVDPDQIYEAKPALLTLNRAIEQGRKQPAGAAIAEATTAWGKQPAGLGQG